VHKTYRLGRVKVPVLHGVNLTVQEGEFVAILGASGSGKSTLLHLMGGLDRPDRTGGEPPTIEFRGNNLTGMSRRQLDRYRARDAGFVFQFYHLLPELTVLDNVLIAAMVRRGLGYLPYAGACRDAARGLLDQVGLSHRLNHRPVELSGGERQRVAIARALINEPTLLLADEPTGNLDHATGESILDMLLAIRAQRRLTMLVVTHDQATAARADRTVRIADGRIVAG
jgi:lipoprotein-releasing system ATP-binding protein